MLHPKLVVLGKDLAEKVGNHFARIAYLRVGKLGVVPGVSGAAEKKESGQAGSDAAHQDSRCPRCLCSLKEGERGAEGFAVLPGSVKFSYRKKNEVDVNLFLPLKTLFIVAEYCPATAALHPRAAAR